MTRARPYSTRPFNEATVVAAITQQNPTMTPADRAEVVRRLLSVGVGRAEAARLARCSDRTVRRATRIRVESETQRWARYRRELPQIVASRFPGEEAV